MAPKPNSIFNKMKNLVGDSPAGANPGQRSPAGQQHPMHQQPLQQQNSAGGTTAGGANAHLGQSYVHFMRGSSEQLQQVVVDEVWVNRLLQVKIELILHSFHPYIVPSFQDWYDGQIRMVNEWLTERLQQSLSPYQLTCLSFMVKVCSKMIGRGMSNFYV